MTDLSNVSFRAPVDPAARMRIGRVFDATYRTFRLAPGRLIGIGLLPLILSGASAVPGLFQNPNSQSPTTAIAVAIVSLGITIAQYIVQVTAQGAAVYAGSRLLAGSSFTMGEAFGAGFRRFLPMFGLSILMGLIIFAGLVLLIIPGFVAACVLAVAWQVCILERRGPIESIKRSVYLTRHNRWRILGAYLVTFLPIMATFVIVVGLAIGFFTVFRDAPLALSIVLGIGFGLVLILVAFVSVGITGVFLAVLFFELRQIKEGIGPKDGIAGVFD